MMYHFRKTAFTLAEVLITLGIIGVVAALTLSTVITNINNKGYVEGLKKAYSVLQEATTAIVYEEGTPDTWTWTSYLDADNSANGYIAGLYRKHLNPYCSNDKSLYYGDTTFCNGIKIPDYKDLMGHELTPPPFIYTCPFVLNDGTIVSMFFKFQSGMAFWENPDIKFVVDVNGVKGPNKLGRDVFFLYMTKKDKSGKILPYVNEPFSSGNVAQKDTCDKGKPGYSCAYRVITEGKMNY